MAASRPVYFRRSRPLWDNRKASHIAAVRPCLQFGPPRAYPLRLIPQFNNMAQNIGKTERVMGQDVERPCNLAIVAAASGIGRAAADALAAEGTPVVCLDSNIEGAGETVATIAGDGQKAIAYRLYATDPAGVAATMAKVFGEVGQLYSLVNCAGITGKTNIKGHEVDLE